MNVGTGGDALVAGLKAHNIHTVFGLPGVQIPQDKASSMMRRKIANLLAEEQQEPERR